MNPNPKRPTSQARRARSVVTTLPAVSLKIRTRIFRRDHRASRGRFTSGPMVFRLTMVNYIGQMTPETQRSSRAYDRGVPRCPSWMSCQARRSTLRSSNTTKNMWSRNQSTSPSRDPDTGWEVRLRPSRPRLPLHLPPARNQWSPMWTSLNLQSPCRSDLEMERGWRHASTPHTPLGTSTRLSLQPVPLARLGHGFWWLHSRARNSPTNPPF